MRREALYIKASNDIPIEYATTFIRNEFASQKKKLLSKGRKAIDNIKISTAIEGGDFVRNLYTVYMEFKSARIPRFANKLYRK